MTGNSVLLFLFVCATCYGNKLDRSSIKEMNKLMKKPEIPLTDLSAEDGVNNEPRMFTKFKPVKKKIDKTKELKTKTFYPNEHKEHTNNEKEIFLINLNKENPKPYVFDDLSESNEARQQKNGIMVVLIPNKTFKKDKILRNRDMDVDRKNRMYDFQNRAIDKFNEQEVADFYSKLLKDLRNVKIHSDYRKRLQHFMPKRYHWYDEDLSNLGYYWFNGPQGKYPGPFRMIL